MEFMEFIDIFTFYNSYLNLIPLELNFIILNYLDEVSDIDNAILHMNFTTENFKELIRNTFFDIDINKVIHINWNSDNPIYFQTIFLKLIGQYKKAKKAIAYVKKYENPFMIEPAYISNMELLLIEDNESKEWDIYAFDLIDQTSMGETNGRFEIRYYKNFKINTKYREYYIQEEIEYYEEGFEDVSERYVLNLFVHIGYNGNDYFEGDINNPERDY